MKQIGQNRKNKVAMTLMYHPGYNPGTGVTSFVAEPQTKFF